MTACDYLARVGYDHLLDRLGGPTGVPDLSGMDDPGEMAAAEEAARSADHARVREHLLSEAPTPRAGDMDGARWLGLVITWPDRVPGLKTWAGQSTLPKIVAAHQRRLRDAPGGGLLWDVRGVYRTSKNEGPSGLDPLTCQDAVDTGFSPKKLGMDVECRPAVELLAVVGLETVPLASFGPRDCGFLHAGRAWRFAVEPRDGGYYHRWGGLREWDALVTGVTV